ncbi:cytoplasmic protein [Chitiniphilus eburneus]|uniref:Cytoplasmic protein n=1 Tax=Chitiniphilus eburneus TaxID=2571148 RepID=A0A4V5MR02_9NEIS|nr:cytoplasmic protein [Chitiniphilus eburneus]TJZ74248.1 cytoplasmic protein [Chitiniphilus eburneus]
MDTYRLIIHRHGRLLGHFESSTPGALEAVKDITARLGADDGYRIELQIADGERRLLESSPDGIRLLGCELLFRPVLLSA